MFTLLFIINFIYFVPNCKENYYQMNNINLSRNTNDITNDKIDNTPYDDVFKTLRTDSPSLLIPVVNELFHENYSGEEKIIILPNDHMIHLKDNTTKEKRTTI